MIAGIDEAGRGPWAGPVVAAAVIISRTSLGVRIDDSKRLSVRQRLVAYDAITACASVGVGIVSSARIDAENIRAATLRAMAQAVSNLPQSPELVLVDGLDAPAVSVPCWTIVGGDHLSFPIACASIIAKVTRDALMSFYHRLFPAYGFHRHKGYGTDDHREALRAHGACPLHRMSFRPIAELRGQSPQPLLQRSACGEPLSIV